MDTLDISNAKVWDHFSRPRHVGRFDPAAPDVGSARLQASAIRAGLALQIKVVDEDIVAACFKAYGCGVTIACASWLSDWVIGKTLNQARALHNATLAEALALAPLKMPCAVLAERALKTAVDDYLNKRGKPCRLP